MMTPSNISTNEGSRLRSSQEMGDSSPSLDSSLFADFSMASEKQMALSNKENLTCYLSSNHIYSFGFYLLISLL